MQKGRLPGWAKRHIRITREVAGMTRRGRNNDGGVPAETRRKVSECFGLAGTMLVFSPAVPEGLRRREAAEIERAAERAVKKGYRPKPEYYPVPAEYRKDSLKKGYYLARLEYEIRLREGYKKRGGRAG